MIKIPTASQMREIDAATMREEPVSSLELMERAASAAAQVVMSEWDNRTPIVVFAGSGNNGGDALAVARILCAHGYKVEAYLFNTGGKLSMECRANRERLSECPEGLTFTEVTTQFEPPHIEKGTLVIDGLFGTGLNKPLEGGFAQLVALINNSPAEVVSLDMPSGLMCDDNRDNRTHIVRATLTLTFQLPKLSLLLADNQPYVGRLRILDIGLSRSAIEALPAAYALSEDADFLPLIQPRKPFSHKGNYGHALLIAGKYGMAGAAILAARACLRSGVGKLTVHTPQMNNDILQTAVPEAILHHDISDEAFTTPVGGELRDYSALAIGCGIGTSHETAAAFIEQVRRTQIPLLIDADGLNILAAHRNWIARLPMHTILTPHPAEFRRLVSTVADDGEALTVARKMAVERKLFIVLKGHRTAICSPDGMVLFNTTGNAGMATAGSGDVLTGVITALLAQGLAPGDACGLGVRLHGLAGDLAAEKVGEESLIASDIIDHLPAAFRTLRAKKNA